MEAATSLLLRAFITLDALHRGKGSRGVFAVLGQQLVICERLCIEGYLAHELRTVRHAHAAMINSDVDARSSGQWILSGTDYEAVCAALDVFGRQLDIAPRPLVAKAMVESAMIVAPRRETPVRKAA